MGLLSFKKKNKKNLVNLNNPKSIAKAINSGDDDSSHLLFKYKSDDEVMSCLIDLNPNYIFDYKGYNVKIFKRAMNKLGPNYDDKFLENEYVRGCFPLMKILVKNNPYNIVYYTGICFDELVETTPFSKDIPWFYLEYYNFDPVHFIDNFNSIKVFLNKCNINIDTFFQYQLGSNKNWLNEMMSVINNDKVDEFINVKDYFFKNYYDETNSVVFTLNNFIDILTNYNNYSSFCNVICNKSELSYNDIVGIKFLFSGREVEFLSRKVKSLSDLDEAKEYIKSSYFRQLEIYKSMVRDNNKIPRVIQNKITMYVESMLFNDVPIHQLLGIYGNTENLKILQFNNRNNPKLSKLIGEMTIYTSIMESISKCTDVNKIIDLGFRIIDNFDIAVECSSFFQSYEEKLRKLYELDCKYNLTRLDKIKDYDSYLDKVKTKKYGVEVLDLSDKAYLLLGHVQSFNESVEEIVNGNSSGLKNFISFNVFSYLKQVPYYNSYMFGDEITFGYYTLLGDSFVLSSPRNMFTNSHIHYNSSEVSTVFRIQRGILETSNPEYYDSSELFAFREGLKPGCIIVPKDREISNKEIEIAKKYNLSIVITQELNKGIDNPKKIEFKEDEIDIKYANSYDNDRLISINNEIDKLIKDGEEKENRKIAIFADSHGLYEPTLAILEDCRRQGITEIYSLGDNIGTGPNPDEVLDLLDEYGVKSVMGNHEIYVGDGLESLEEHLIKTGAYEEALNNSEWTRNHLSSEHLKNIRLYPKTIELLFGGKKLALIHSIRNYNNGERIIDTDNYDKVFQGHIHFEGVRDNVYTLRGAGIGDSSSNKAFYLVLTEKDDGGYTIERRLINYDKRNLQGGIIGSDLSNYDKSKISHWVGK